MKKEYDFSVQGQSQCGRWRQFMVSERQPLEASLRRVVREELAAYRKGRGAKGR